MRPLFVFLTVRSLCTLSLPTSLSISTSKTVWSGFNFMVSGSMSSGLLSLTFLLITIPPYSGQLFVTLRISSVSSGTGLPALLRHAQPSACSISVMHVSSATWLEYISKISLAFSVPLVSSQYNDSRTGWID
jgi:hypothetical protein